MFARTSIFPSSSLAQHAAMTVRDAYYTVALHGGREQFTIDTKYKIIRKVGSGSYGIVCSAIDLTNNNGT